MATFPLKSPTGRWVLTATILASAMAFIDSTALNVVLPALQKGLNASGADLFWVLNAYLLVLAALILVGGSLGDRLGRKRVYMIGICIFIGGSAACGLAPDVNFLIGFRVLQGVGGALMIPGSLSLLSSSIDPGERGKAIGTWSAITTVVTMGGPVLGGALADAGLWRDIFFINIPIGLATLLMLWRKVPESKEAGAGKRVDISGVLAIALGLAALTFGFLRMPDLGLGSWEVWGALVLGVVLLGVFVWIEARSAQPMMPLGLFANRTFSAVNALTFFLYAGLGAGMLFLSLDLVQAQGYSQLESGLTFLPFTVLMISIARWAGTMADKYGARLFLIVGPAMAGLGLLLLSFVGATRGPVDYWTHFLPGVLVLGLGMSFTVAPLTTTVMSSASDEHSGVASGINNAMTRIAGVFANAIFGALAVLFFIGALEGRLKGLSLSAEQRQAVIAQAANLGNAKAPPEVGAADRAVVQGMYREGFIAVYGDVLRLAAGLAFLGAVMGLLFVRRHSRYLLVLVLFLCRTIATGQSLSTDSLLAVVRENKQDHAEAKALNALAAGLVRSDIPRAIGYLHQDVALCIKIGDTAYLTRAYNQLVTSHLHSGRRDSAAYYLSLLKGMAEHSASVDARTDFHMAAGLFYKIEGNYKAALPYLLASLDDARAITGKDPSINNKTYLAGQYLNIGNTYTVMADYRKALAYHLQSLHLFEEVANKQGISYCYQGIGGDFLSLGQLPSATEYTKKAILLKTEMKDQRGIGTALKQQGSIFRGAKQWDSTLAYYFQALKVFQGMNLKVEEADLDFDIGNVYGDKADLPNARNFLNNGKAVDLEMGDSTRYKAAEAALLSLEGRVGRQQQDELRLMSSLKASVESGDREMQLANYQYLSDHYASTRQYDKALYYTRKYYEMHDSVQGRDVQLQLQKLEKQYNVEKEEHEIRLLKEDQQVTRLVLQRDKVMLYGALVVLGLLVLVGFLIFNRHRAVSNARRIIEMEKMRNTIARDLHDDIGSTLTSINVLSKVALEPQEDGFVRSSLQKIKDRSSAIMEKMDDIVWAINPQHDTMEELLSRMKEFAAELLEPANIDYQFEEKGDFTTMKLDVRRRKELYLLFKEAVNNAMKYSGCRTIVIRLEQEHGRLRMEIGDDGIGFDEGQVRGGNGLNNMRERAASMEGRLLIDSAAGRGTRILLTASLA